jgi:hypothetical protein
MKEYITDDKGKHEVIRQKNGIVVKKLVEPSAEYRVKMDKRKEEFKKKAEIEKVEQAQEVLIQTRMREIAINQLKSEGKLK